MEPDCRITLRTKPKEEATDRLLIVALMGDQVAWRGLERGFAALIDFQNMVCGC
jgi:hypothetical protein